MFNSTFVFNLPRIITTVRTIGISTLVVVIQSSSAANAGYIITDPGTLGGNLALGYAINSSGQVTGVSSTPTGQFRAFRYSNGSMVNLGTLGNSASESRGFAINTQGNVVGNSQTNQGFRAFFYANGTMTDIGTLGGNFTGASGINDSNSIVGTSQTATFQARAFLYSGGMMTDLGTLGGSSSQALGINNAGQVVGTSLNASGQNRAFIFENGAMVDLGTLGGQHSQGTAINEHGVVAGYSRIANGDTHAFVSSSSGLIDIGVLGPNGVNSLAYGINNHGDVVGTSVSTTETSAFLYSNGVLHNLNDLLPANSGWHLIEARGINDNGQITGYGTLNGQTRAFVLSPEEQVSPVPEPSSIALWICGFISFLAIARRRLGQGCGIPTGAAL